ncbi:MAG: hypothetical protein ACK6D7_01365, partial [Acidobacteriota bacterium]
MPHNPLSGIRLWLSGSVPDGASSDLRERIERCTRLLAEKAFSLNATLLHGFHPSLTPPLLAAAALTAASPDVRVEEVDCPGLPATLD